MSEEKTRVKKFIEDGKIKWKRVPLSLQDELEERDKLIEQLKKLVDELRSKLEVYEQEEQRQKLRSSPAVDEAESYRIYG